MSALDAFPPPISTCCICGATLPASGRSDGPVCRVRLCRHRYATIPKHRLCTQCGRPMPSSNLSRGVCESASCGRAAERAIASKIHEAKRRRHAGLRDAAARRGAVEAPESFGIRELPSQRANIVRLSIARRERLRVHLEALVEQVTAGLPQTAAQTISTPPHSVTAATQRAVARACTLCKGHCCTSGGDQAWLDAKTIRRQLDAHPNQPAAAVVDLYLSFLGPLTYCDSCVYHGARGCSLPAGLRADICNHFFCGAVSELRAESAAARAVREFFIVHDVRGRERGTFVAEQDDTGLR